jgi:4-hydroxybenzoate polyprenyltransferase
MKQATAKISEIPLAVDLDRTLIKTDLLWESLCALLKQNPLATLLIPFWLFKGKAVLKRELAKRARLDIASLPCNISFLNFLREEHHRGRDLVLTTAADLSYAQQIADHLGIFSEVLASENGRNMKGRHKAKALEERFGKGGFEYAGNEFADLQVWQTANSAVIVNPTRGLVQRSRKIVPITRVFHDEKDRFGAFLRALRIKQWAKNFLLFIPLFTAHDLENPHLLLKAMWAFLAFSLMASSVYVFNDLMDLESDRLHPEKKRRPFASGELSLAVGLGMIPLLVGGGFLVSWLLPVGFLVVLGVYWLTNLAYSLFLKTLVLVDVFLLAFFYALRVIAGGSATGIVISKWLLAFSVFIFISLAFAKRVSELYTMRELHSDTAKGRGYRTDDLEHLITQGSISGYLAVLVFALYISSTDVKLLYGSPEVLWLLCPLLLYWISRLWLWVSRRNIFEDPILFLMKDRQSYLIGLAIVLVVIVASA